VGGFFATELQRILFLLFELLSCVRDCRSILLLKLLGGLEEDSFEVVYAGLEKGSLVVGSCKPRSLVKHFGHLLLVHISSERGHRNSRPIYTYRCIALRLKQLVIAKGWVS